MFDRIVNFLGLRVELHSDENALALATAALLVCVSRADGDFSDEERAQLVSCLTGHFGLAADVAEDMIARAEAEADASTSLYDFTHQITRALDQDGRQEIVRLLWRVALADHVVDNFEENALAKIAGLLGVIPEDRIRLKHEVMAE